MDIAVDQFKDLCLKLVDEVHSAKSEIVITKHGKPWAKLVAFAEKKSQPFLGSYTGIGKTVGDLLEPFEEEWDIE
ncbi:MAG: type II toxin-antitoxin system prevent-host-death family antitoxin [Gammaproteobacteria bacterium]|nr:type II toxin-antitoxin system prevent-host-death family antitoxin [Gammaproteobacteria bacterium]